MSIQAVAWALDQNIRDPYEKLILISLANHADHTSGFCYPPMRLIAKEASCDRRTVLRKLPSLVEAGRIRIVPHRDGKQRLAHFYQLLMPGCDSQSQPPSKKRSGSAEKSGQSVTRGSDTRVATKNRHSSINLPLPLLRASTGPGPTQATPPASRSGHFESAEVVQNRVVKCLGRGDIASGWVLFGELSESVRDQLTAQERAHRLDAKAIENALLSIRPIRG